MHNLWFEITIYFLLGVISFFIVNYLIYKLSESKDKIIFTKGISTDVITFTKDYQEILTARLGENAPYFVTHDISFSYILAHHWTIFDIKKWLESLNDQDYSILLEFVGKSVEGYALNNPRIILSKEFIINNSFNVIIQFKTIYWIIIE